MKTLALFIEQDCATELELDCEFSAEACLAWYVKDREDDGDVWSIMDDSEIAGMRFVQIGEEREGETRKFIYKGN